MKVVTLLTPTHRRFLEQYFLPSFPHDPRMDLIIKFKEQHCKTAEFESDGWWLTMKDKADCFYETLTSLAEGEKFIFADVDIQFFGNFYDDLIDASKDVDIAFQNDIGGGVNTGFFIAQNNENTRMLFKAVQKYLKKYSNEQKAMTDFCFNHRQYYELRNLKWTMLDPNKYWTYGVFKKHYTGDNNFDVPEGMLMHHANWTEKFELKFDLLDEVKRKLDKK